ncbi:MULTISPECIES: hypothetical protein [unclassified Chryseobacterium]|nr:MULTISPECIES: hypothetical protein [unclassified Chryseobacterium]
MSAGFAAMPEGKIPLIKFFTDGDDELRYVKAGSSHFTVDQILS